MPCTAAVVVDWQRPRETLDALNSLASMSPKPDSVFCVENGGTEEGLALIRSMAPALTTLVELPENVGFAAAANLGVDRAVASGAEWVLLLNNDATVASGCLRRCLEEALAFPQVAAVSPAIALADRPDRLWYGGGEVSPWFAFTRHRALNGPAAAPPPSGPTAFATGCCMLISAKAWVSIGPFRADFFAYYEDAEWCQRATAAGWTCRYLGEVLCTHAAGVSSGLRGSFGLSEHTAYYKARNPLRFALETRAAPRRLSRVIGLMLVWNAYHAWRIAESRSRRVAQGYWRGIHDAFKGQMGPYSKRRT